MKFVTQDYYQILNLSPEANGEDLKKAYRTVRQSFRPDSMAVHSLYSPEETEAISAKIDEAFQILSQPEHAGNYRRYHRNGRVDMAVPRRPEVFFDEVHNLDGSSPIEALAVAVSNNEQRAEDLEEDSISLGGDDAAAAGDAQQPESIHRAEPDSGPSDMLLSSLDEVSEASRGNSSHNRPAWTPAPLAQRSSSPALSPVPAPDSFQAQGSSVAESSADLKVTSPSLKTLNYSSGNGIDEGSTARDLSPAPRPRAPVRSAIPGGTVLAREYAALSSEELEAIEVDCGGVNGAYLRQVREALGLDLYYIAAHTKIGRAMLGYIEDDCSTELPARVYLKGYLGHISRLLKLSDGHTAERYLANLQAD